MLGEFHPTNPKYLLTPGDFEMERLWRLFAPGMGAGYLPDDGGTLDQAAVMMDAFGVMSAAEQELRGARGGTQG